MLPGLANRLSRCADSHLSVTRWGKYTSEDATRGVLRRRVEDKLWEKRDGQNCDTRQNTGIDLVMRNVK